MCPITLSVNRCAFSSHCCGTLMGAIFLMRRTNRDYSYCTDVHAIRLTLCVRYIWYIAVQYYCTHVHCNISCIVLAILMYLYHKQTLISVACALHQMAKGKPRSGDILHRFTAENQVQRISAKLYYCFVFPSVWASVRFTISLNVSSRPLWKKGASQQLQFHKSFYIGAAADEADEQAAQVVDHNWVNTQKK